MVKLNDSMGFVKKILQNNFVQITIVVGGLAITVINLYITSLLAPLNEGQRELVGNVEAVSERVQNIEDTQMENKDILERVTTLEANQILILDAVKEIRGDIKLILAQ